MSSTSSGESVKKVIDTPNTVKRNLELGLRSDFRLTDFTKLKG